MASKPRIHAIEPVAAVTGGEVHIRGDGFRSVNGDRPRVNFGGVEGPLVVGSESFLVARVPEGALSGEVTVFAGNAQSDSFGFEVGVTIAENLHPVANPAVDPHGNIYATFSGSRGQKVPTSVFRIDLNYNMRPLVTDLMNATALAFDRSGTLYVSSRHDGTVYRVGPSGGFATYVEGMGIATGLAFDHENFLYVGDRSGTIFKISQNKTIFVFATLEPSIAAYHLAFGPDGYLYVTGPTTSSFDCIYRISPAGEVEVFYRGLGRPQGMAFDEKGRLYVCASLRGRKGVVRLASQSKAELVVSGVGLVGLAFLGRGLVLASSNSLYYLNWDTRGLPLPA
jgi:hypothetical protein